MRYIIDPRTGQRILVRGAIDPRTGRPILVQAAEPGIAHGYSSDEELLARLPDADLAGAIGPGVVPGGEQGKGARRAEIEQVGQPVSPPTYRPLGGAKQSFRGNSREISFPVGITNSAAVESLVQTPRDAGDDAELITISLGMAILPPIGTAIRNGCAVIASADLVWGIGGAIFSASVDWNQGTIISLPASYLQVNANVIVVFGVAPIPGQEVRVTLSAALAYGTAASRGYSSPARRTIDVATVLAAGASSPLTEIPPFATSVTVLGNPSTLTIGLTRKNPSVLGDGAGFSVVNSDNTGNQNESQFPIPNGMRLFNVTNIGLAAVNNIKAIFNISI